MPRLFPIVTDRKTFFKLLNDAITQTADLIATNPDNVALQSFAKQLDAMKRWTESGRKPTFDERRTINMGMTAQRIIQTTNNADLSVYLTLVTALDSYFKFWRTDAGLEALDESDWRTSFPSDYDFSDE